MDGWTNARLGHSLGYFVVRTSFPLGSVRRYICSSQSGRASSPQSERARRRRPRLLRTFWAYWVGCRVIRHLDLSDQLLVRPLPVPAGGALFDSPVIPHHSYTPLYTSHRAISTPLLTAPSPTCCPHLVGRRGQGCCD